MNEAVGLFSYRGQPTRVEWQNNKVTLTRILRGNQQVAQYKQQEVYFAVTPTSDTIRLYILSTLSSIKLENARILLELSNLRPGDLTSLARAEKHCIASSPNPNVHLITSTQEFYTHLSHQLVSTGIPNKSNVHFIINPVSGSKQGVLVYKKLIVPVIRDLGWCPIRDNFQEPIKSPDINNIFYSSIITKNPGYAQHIVKELLPRSTSDSSCQSIVIICVGGKIESRCFFFEYYFTILFVFLKISNNFTNIICVNKDSKNKFEYTINRGWNNS